jgi:RNA polymerase sigma-70 factor (sigma-E family)
VPDREATFADFVRARWPRLVRLAYSLTLDVGRAEDLVQESLAKLWPVWPRIRDGSPEAYVRRTIVNGAISASRRRWRAEEPHWDVPELPTAAESDGIDTRDLVRRELARLSVLQRAVVVLRYAEDLTEQQVAEMLGISPGTVKTHASRGLTRLRRTVPDAMRWPDADPAQPGWRMRPVTGQAVTGQAATGQAVTGQAVTGQAATGRAATGRGEASHDAPGRPYP